MEFIFNLSGEDFVGLVLETFNKENSKIKREQNEFLLHRWGYELPFMEKVLQFEEYVKIAFGESNVINNVGRVNKINKEEIIRKMEAIKSIHQGKS